MLNNPSLNQKPIEIKRALISVFDKTGIVKVAQTLHGLGVEILSTGGTSAILKNKNIPVTDVSDYTGFPEIMDGRVKTINPLIEGGILGLRDRHIKDASENRIKWIDLVICNLYPFSDVITKEGSSLSKEMENIDIGGPTMIRAAAKNLGWACVVVDPADYTTIIDEVKTGKISYETRKKFSVKAFGHTAKYDVIIHNHLYSGDFPNDLSLTYEKHSELRYGENPHQVASVYKITNNQSGGILNAKIHQGKTLSYNNIMDADAALSCLREFDKTACVVVKHANPCGVSEGKNVLDAYKRAFNADRLSAFGGIVALNKRCTREVAEEINSVFVEIVLAPSFHDGALEIFSKKKNLRVLEFGKVKKRVTGLEVRNLNGGLLVQGVDISKINKQELKVVTNIAPSKRDVDDMLFGWKALKHIKSNAILLVKNRTTVGVGAGQVSRVDAVDVAIKKAGENISNNILCSDAFFPFRDSIDKIANTGIKAVIQPGGSIRDKEVISACNEHQIAMVFTGKRCFKH